MATKILGPTGSRRRRRFLFGPLFLAVLVALFVTAGAQAVHNLDFELEGNIADDAGDGFDWASFFNSSGTPTPALPDASRPGFSQSSFSVDFVLNASGPDRTTYATGSKDILSITPGWQCGRSSNTGDKVDLLNAYALTYKDPDTGHDILYFGMERFSNEGDANIAFWFLQDPEVGCLAPASGPSNTPFTGDHVDGDLLIVSSFTNGGVVSTVDVYEWVGGADGELDTTPVFSGVDCKAAATPTLDPGCATVNTAPITPPWPTQDKDGDSSLDISEFYEGGIDLTANELGGRCFTTFMSNTRSSQELNATLFDFTLGTLPACESAMTTQISDLDGEFTIGGSVTDSATIHVTRPSGGPDPTGVVSFFICGPSPGIATCDENGTAFGTKDLSTATEVGDDFTVTSDVFTPVEAGDYCFFASWPGDDNYPAAEVSDFTDECFTVNPALPTIITVATGSGGVVLGSAIDDTATLTGTSPQPDGDPANGTITFTAYGPHSDTETCTTLAYTSVVTVSGDGPYTASAGDADGDTIPGEVPDDQFIPTAVGTYNWIASYSGDPPNTSPVSGACGDDNEASVVNQVPSAIATAQNWLPNDSATITAAIGGIDGTVTFSLHTSSDCSAASQIYSEVEDVPANSASGVSVDTDNETFTIDVSNDGTFYWKAVYSGDTEHIGTTSCVEESTVTIDNDNTTP